MAAKMIPEFPRQFALGSLENVMFSSLEKLPEDYYVFHSFSLLTIKGITVHESETDFVIFNRKKGILCLEAKAGRVKYHNGEWYYGSGIKMAHDGPYNQARRNKWKIKDYIYNSVCASLLDRCKLLHAVWFPSISSKDLKTVVMPPEALYPITMTYDDLSNPLDAINHIFAEELPNQVKTDLSEKEEERLFRYVLCPSFDLVPALSMENDLKKQVFYKMLAEQKCVLNYLIEQKTVVIQGAAGTGKTLIALEKARRHADNGDKVLFLCYNKMLHDFIAGINAHENIDFYTVDGFACKIGNTSVPDYRKLRDALEEEHLDRSFPYDHVIIDEGQDFGQVDIEENRILELLKDIIADREATNGSFYVFYDGLQFVQGATIPTYLSTADCKLTLYKNCRNTENIAKTSMKPIRGKKPKLIEGCIKGKVPKMVFCSSEEQQKQQVSLAIKKLEETGFSDIVILTCATENSSILAPRVFEGKYERKYLFASCRRFKGLEADAIIIVDITKKILTTEAAKIFYVGASRARLELYLICSLTETDCKDILKAYGVNEHVQNPAKILATELHTLYSKPKQ